MMIQEIAMHICYLEIAKWRKEETVIEGIKKDGSKGLLISLHVFFKYLL